MTDQKLPKRIFPRAKEDAASASRVTSTRQTEHSAYRLAFQDKDFLLREDLRPVRFQLELLKPELLLDEAGIASTFVFYGSARIPEPDDADRLVEAAKTETQEIIAQKLKDKAKYYDEARRLARLASATPTERSSRRSSRARRNIMMRREGWPDWPARRRRMPMASAIWWFVPAAAPRSWKRPIAARTTSGPIRSG